MKLKLLVALSMLLFVISCGKEEPTCETEGLTYTNDIKSLLDTSCAVVGCHVEMGGSFDMSTYETTKIAVDFGRIAGAINHEAGFVPMPLSADKLNDCDIDQIIAWLDDGAPE